MGAPLETVTIQHERANKPRQERISRNVKAAVDIMVFEGLPRAEAAKKANIADHSLYKALRKPPVLAYMNTQMGVLRTSAAARSLSRIDKLADTANSETVRLGASEYLYEVEHGKPTQRTENTHVHAVLVPGLTIVRGAQPAVHVIDGQVHEVDKPPHLLALPAPVPHPGMRNAQSETDLIEAKTATRGAKSRARNPRG